MSLTPGQASFAVQTISSIWQASQERRLERLKVKRGIEPKLDRAATVTFTDTDDGSPGTQDSEFEPFCSHTELVIASHAELFANRTKMVASEKNNGQELLGDDPDRLLDNMLQLANELECHARRIILDKLEPGSRPRLLLQADTNIMRKNLAKYSETVISEPDVAPEVLDDLGAIQYVLASSRPLMKSLFVAASVYIERRYLACW